LALVCMAGFMMMTACGGEKKADKTEVASQEEEVVAEAEESEAEANEATDLWGDPAKASLVDLAALYEAGDFKPCLNDIFFDAQEGEAAGELPSKWEVRSGSAEIGAAQDMYYITLLGGDAQLMPKVGDNTKNYLPEKYTMEFEFMFGCDVFFHVNFFDAEDNGVGDYDMWVAVANWNMAKQDDEWIGGDKGDMETIMKRDGWNHFAVSYDKGNMKLYVNGKRIANLPNIKQAAYFIIRGDGANGDTHYLKNIRIAK